MTALAVKGLSVQRGGKVVLDNVSFSAVAGEVVGILGPNGAGKSTFFAAVVGQIPSSGTVEIMGRGRMRSHADLATAVALIPQEREVAWPMRVEAVVALGRLPYQSQFERTSLEDCAAIERAMAAVDVLHLRERRIDALSGGERSRVLIARALAQDTPLLLADEPTSGLDPAHQIALLDLFREQAKLGLTIVLTMHELHLAARWCDRIVLLHETRIAADGAPAEVLTQAHLATVYGCGAHICYSSGELLVVPTRLRAPGDKDRADNQGGDVRQ